MTAPPLRGTGRWWLETALLGAIAATLIVGILGGLLAVTRSDVSVRLHHGNDVEEVFVNCERVAYVNDGAERSVDLGWLRNDDLITLEVTNDGGDYQAGFELRFNDGADLRYETGRKGVPKIDQRGLVYLQTLTASRKKLGPIGCSPDASPHLHSVGPRPAGFWRAWPLDPLGRLPQILPFVLAGLGFLVLLLETETRQAVLVALLGVASGVFPESKALLTALLAGIVMYYTLSRIAQLARIRIAPEGDKR